MLFLYPLLVVAVDLFCVFAWMSQKCIVLDKASPTPPLAIRKLHNCDYQQLRAACQDVSDFAVDLSTVPKDIKVLCVWIDHGSTLQPNALTRFHSLRSLYIHGCLSAILPEAFRGLTNLHLLSMSGPKHCSASVQSKVFHDLYNLEELKLENYMFSAANVFDGPSRMKKFDFKGNNSFSELLCKLSSFSASLEYLSIEMDVETLMTPNCTYSPSQFPSLREVIFSFPNIMTIDRNAFKNIGRLSLLSMPINDVLHAQLLHSGIQHIDEMDLRLTVANIQSICEIVLALSVNTINLKFNTLQEYSQSSWEKCHKLEKIILIGTDLASIDLSFMSNLPVVKEFNSANMFEGSTSKQDRSLDSLCKTNLFFSSLNHFSYRTTQNLTLRTSQFACLSHLEALYLMGGNINLEDFAFEGLNVLRILHIWAQFSVLRPKLFSNLVNMEELDLHGCSIQTINDFAFRNLSKLRHINLKANAISEITTNAFFGLQNLESLNLGDNLLGHLEPSSFNHFPSLRVLYLEDLKFSSAEHTGMQVLNLSLIFGSFPRQLSELTITSVTRPMTLVISDDSTPKVGLSLSLSGRKIVIWGCERPFLKSVTKLQVVTDFFLCAPDNAVAFDHFTSTNYLQFTQMYFSAVQSLSVLNRLVYLKYLSVVNVNLSNHPDINLMFRNLTKLESLCLSRCWVDALEGELSQDLASLKYFFLTDIASDVRLTTDFFEHLTSLRFVLIYKQLSCTCDNVLVLRWAKNQQQTEVLVSNYLTEPHQCISEGGLHDLDSYGQAHCSLDVGFVLFVSTSCFLLLFMTFVLLHQLARDYLLAFYHIAHGWLHEVLHHHQETSRRYLYDAFVSYSSRDERWVVEKLLPSLEQKGPPFLHLCLHSRDFQLGKDIVENITDSLYRSRHTICLVSRHYLRSNWCSLEMRLGTYRLQVEHRDVLILVFLEKIPSNLLSAHHRLARLVKTRTYIEWPQDATQQEAFWERLWKKLLPDRVE